MEDRWMRIGEVHIERPGSNPDLAFEAALKELILGRKMTPGLASVEYKRRALDFLQSVRLGMYRPHFALSNGYYLREVLRHFHIDVEQFYALQLLIYGEAGSDDGPK